MGLALEELYNKNIGSILYKWPRYVKHLKINNVFESLHINNEWLQEDEFRSLLDSIEYKVIELQPRTENYNKEKWKYCGVGFNNDFDVEKRKNFFIKAPGNSIIGVIKFSQGNDFAMLSPSNFRNLYTVKFSKSETMVITKGLTSHRSGSSGGIVTSSTNSKSLSKVTENSRLLTRSKKGVGMKVAYENMNTVKEYSGVYNQIKMRRLSKYEKKIHALKSDVYRHILISEMKSRIQALFLANYLGYIGSDSLKQFTETDQFSTKILKEMLKKGHSKFDSMLLAWALSTGEMRNHQALYAHVDGNKSHCVETLSLFGRVASNENLSSKRVVDKMKEGYLVFPMDGIAIQMNCGIDTIHCCLQKTLHVPDRSRDRHNWSKVHGP